MIDWSLPVLKSTVDKKDYGEAFIGLNRIIEDQGRRIEELERCIAMDIKKTGGNLRLESVLHY